MIVGLFSVLILIQSGRKGKAKYNAAISNHNTKLKQEMVEDRKKRKTHRQSEKPVSSVKDTTLALVSLLHSTNSTVNGDHVVN